jgi:hypothetical protein
MTMWQAIVPGMAVAVAPSIVAMAWLWWKEREISPSSNVMESGQPIYDLEDAPT